MKIGHFVSVDGIKTHYFEAERSIGASVLLLHSAEFGFGLTDKLFDFGNQYDLRLTREMHFSPLREHVGI